MFLFHQCCVRRAVYFCCFAVIFWWKTGQDSGLHTVFLQEWRSFKVLLQPKNSTWVKITYICKILFPCLCECSFKAGLGIRSFDFWANRSFFAKKWANERFTQKLSNSFIRSFLVSKMSDSLTSFISSERPKQIAHGRSFLVSDLSDSFTSLIFGEWPEQFVHIAHFWWVTWAIRSHHSPKMREWENRSFFKIKKPI